MKNKKRSQKKWENKKAAIVPDWVIWFLYILLGFVLLVIIYVVFKGKIQGALNYIKDWWFG